MALLQFDERNFTLNAMAGALEEYKPSKDVKALQKKVEKFREQAKKLNADLQIIRDEVNVINEARYPELKEIAANAAMEAKKAEVKTK